MARVINSTSNDWSSNQIQQTQTQQPLVQTGPVLMVRDFIAKIMDVIARVITFCSDWGRRLHMRSYGENCTNKITDVVIQGEHVSTNSTNVVPYSVFDEVMRTYAALPSMDDPVFPNQTTTVTTLNGLSLPARVGKVFIRCLCWKDVGAIGVACSGSYILPTRIAIFAASFLFTGVAERIFKRMAQDKQMIRKPSPGEFFKNTFPYMLVCIEADAKRCVQPGALGITALSVVLFVAGIGLYPNVAWPTFFAGAGVYGATLLNRARAFSQSPIEEAHNGLSNLTNFGVRSLNWVLSSCCPPIAAAAQVLGYPKLENALNVLSAVQLNPKAIKTPEAMKRIKDGFSGMLTWTRTKKVKT